MNFINIYHSNPEIFPEKYLQYLFENLTCQEKEKCSNLLFEKDRRNLIVSHSILRFGAGVSFYLPENLFNIELGGNSTQRFNVNDELNAINLSLSHTNGLAICAISNNLKIGIDAEYIEDIDYSEVYNHCLNKSEIEQIKSDDNASNAFLILWTKKEAFLKANGIGLLHNPLKIVCDLYKNTVLDSNGRFNNIENWIDQTLNISPNHICSLAYYLNSEEKFEINIRELSPDELINYFKINNLCLS